MTADVAAAELPNRTPMCDPTNGWTHLWLREVPATLTEPRLWVAGCDVTADPDTLTKLDDPYYPQYPWCALCWVLGNTLSFEDARTRACTRTWRSGRPA